MIASLPMYDLPEVRHHTDRLWQALSDQLGVSVPLSRVADWSGAWHAPDLLFSQTCGYPLTHGFAGKLTVVSTPHYAAPGCSGPHYCSLIMARGAQTLDGLRGARVVINGWDSMSGMLALRHVFAPLAGAGDYFSGVEVSGSHVASLAAVKAGEADVCAVDCVTAGLLQVHRPSALAGLTEIARSPLVPGLPYVTRRGDVAALRGALDAVLADVSLRDTREALLLTGHRPADAADYQVILEMERNLAGTGTLVSPATGEQKNGAQ